MGKSFPHRAAIQSPLQEDGEACTTAIKREGSEPPAYRQEISDAGRKLRFSLWLLSSLPNTMDTVTGVLNVCPGSIDMAH